MNKLKQIYDFELQEQKVVRLFPAWILPVIIISFIVSDALSIYSVIDNLFNQKEYLSIMLTVIVAVLLEVLPMIGAKFYLKQNKTKEDKYILGTLAAAFGLLVFAIVLVRFYTMDLMFSAKVTQLNITGIKTESHNYLPTHGEYAMTFLMSMLPILTSVAAFVLTIMNPPQQKLENLRRLHKIQIADSLITQITYTKELERELMIDLIKRDDILYNEKLDEIKDRAEEMKRRVRELAAEKLGTPHAVTELLETPDTSNTVFTKKELQDNKVDRRPKAA